MTKNIITRKCTKCKGVIEIDVDDVRGVLKYKGSYYHSECFKIEATQKASSNRGKPEIWREALNNIHKLEFETKSMIEQQEASNELTLWLLDNYNITTVPARIYQIIAELKVGKYKGKRCKPIDTKELCECWKWGQRKLNDVAINNKMNHRGPENDVDRLRYDLAILITKYPLFLKHKSKVAAVEASNNFEQKQPNLDYSTLNKSKVDNDNDILDLMDEIF